MERKPVVAGFFYPSNLQELKRVVRDFYGESFKVNGNTLIPPIGIIVPHAGYIYSGETAAKAFKKVFERGVVKRVFLLGPNHTGMGLPISIFPEGSWETPFGKVQVDGEISKYISKALNIPNDEIGHLQEHSLEVQLPFIQYVMDNNFKIIPICMMDQSNSAAKKIGQVLREIISDGDLIVASSDMNHYESHETTLKKDQKVIEKIKNMDIEGIYDTIKTYKITMCGYGPISTLLYIGFNDIEIIEHVTSGERSGDFESVVGYMSAILTSVKNIK